METEFSSLSTPGPRDLSGSDRQQIVVHVNAETLKHRQAGRCELEHGPSIAAETARRLACDAGVVRIVENAEGEPLDVGRRTRTIPPGLRRALTARDKGCRFHHRLLHEGQMVIEFLDDGACRFVKPNGESFENPEPLPTDWTELVAATAVPIMPATAITGWTGERLDLGLAIECLLQQREKGVSAET